MRNVSVGNTRKKEEKRYKVCLSVINEGFPNVVGLSLYLGISRATGREEVDGKIRSGLNVW